MVNKTIHRQAAIGGISEIYESDICYSIVGKKCLKNNT